jgi:hypothetical protein
LFHDDEKSKGLERDNGREKKGTGKIEEGWGREEEDGETVGEKLLTDVCIRCRIAMNTNRG